mmetsp:Transcript_25721/g.45135  ORF Transcript_25721/g.45135 Transcript_25721/m.45135 type:complete len:913 (-) Transcript_25721:3141-5879(-)
MEEQFQAKLPARRGSNGSTPERSGETESIDIMSLLDKQNLLNIKKDFKHCGDDGLCLHEFVQIMLKHLPPIDNKLLLISSLIELFAQIDVNDDKHLEWDEFSNHIIELGMIKQERTFIDAIKYYYPSDWKDESKHDAEIEHMFFSKRQGHLLIAERDSCRYKVYSVKTGRLLHEIEGHVGAIHAFAYCNKPGASMLATAANDLSINLWDELNYVWKQRISVPDIQLVMVWVESVQLLYSAGLDAVIYIWDIDNVALGQNVIKMYNPLPKNDSDQGHRSPITALLPIESLSVLVSADMDGKIFLWEIPNHTHRRTMQQQDKGVYYLDWHSYANCFFSAGLDHDAYVWNPYVSKYIFRLKGHIHSLAGVKSVPNTHQLITADMSGMFKVWDVRTFTCIQNFNTSKNDLNCFEVSYPEKKIIAGFRKLQFFQYDEPKDQNLADEGICIAALYNTVFYTFITIHPKTVKIWNATDGRLVHVFRDLSKGDLTCAAVDSRQRKLYLGDSQGRVVSINVKNGARIKKFLKHSDEVTSLLYWEKNKFLVSSSWDGKVRIHDDSKSDPKGTIRFDNIQHGNSANFVVGNEECNIIASCSDDCTIMITNLITYRQEAVLAHHEAEVKQLIFLTPHFPCLISGDLAGYIYFWAVTPSRIKNNLVLRIRNIVETAAGTQDYSPVQSFAFDPSSMSLYTGDESGRVKHWNLTTVLRKLEMFGETRLSKAIPDEADEARLRITSTFLTSVTLGLRTEEAYTFYESDVSLVHEWVAHKDGITHLHMMQKPYLIITSSFDCNVHIWEPNGTLAGTLILGPNPNWRVRPDIQSKLDNDRSKALSMMRELESNSYSEIIRHYGERNSFDSDDDLMASDFEDEFEIKKEPRVSDTRRTDHKEQLMIRLGISPESEFGRSLEPGFTGRSTKK